MVGWSDVDMAGDRRSGGGLAGRHSHQPVKEKIIQHSALLRSELLTKKQTMLITLPTDKTVTEAAAALEASIQANHFGVMQVHNLKESMTKKGVEFAHECLIFEVCQPQQAKKVLDENMSVSTALPCRISIYEEGGKTILATLKPTTLLAMFNTPQLKAVAQEWRTQLLKS